VTSALQTTYFELELTEAVNLDNILLSIYEDLRRIHSAFLREKFIRSLLIWTIIWLFALQNASAVITIISRY